MRHGYMDESGDASSNRGKQFFTVCVFVAASKNECQSLFQRQLADFKDTFGYEFRKEVKAQNLKRSPDLFRHFLSDLSNLECMAHVACLDTYDNSNSLNSYKPVEKKMFAVKSITAQTIALHEKVTKIVLDRGLWPEKDLGSLISELAKTCSKPPSLKSKSSGKIAGLAYADLMAYSVRKQKEGRNDFYNLIKDKIKISEL